MDFVGNIRLHLHQIHAYPMPEEILTFIVEGIPKLEKMLTDEQRGRIAGIGIATPFQLWSWAEETGAPKDAMDTWHGFDLREEVAARTHHPVLLQNDATSACGAELIFGVGTSYPDFIYFYIGSFIGGGIVLNSSLFSGRTGTAGAVGPLQVSDRNGKPQQLLKIASIYVLENLLREKGVDPKPLWYSADEWIDFGEPLETWIQLTAAALAQAIVSAASIIDFGAAVIDGGFPGWVRTRIVAAIRKAVGELDLEGVIMPDIVEGAVGAQARAIGGASLPLFSRYLSDTNVLFKETA
jgi:predicted NBD/HSP70 family sugar kinase